MGQPTHDHALCIRSALDRAERTCRRAGKTLTPVRRRVLELLWAGHAPVTAYDVLHALHAEGWGSSPPVAYRALAFLVELGLVHRVEHLNAYVGCALAEAAPEAQLFVCSCCGDATEVANPVLHEGLHAAAESIGFTIAHPIIEVTGICRRCREAGHC